MKTKSSTLLAMFFCLGTLPVFSQQTKPSLFNAYPSSIPVSKDILEQAFSASIGGNISIPFSTNFVYAGTVVSNIRKYDNLQSVLVKSPAFGNALLQLSKVTKADNSFYFTGRIINNDTADGYELKVDNNGAYRLQKTQMNMVFQECSF